MRRLSESMAAQERQQRTGSAVRGRHLIHEPAGRAGHGVLHALAQTAPVPSAHGHPQSGRDGPATASPPPRSTPCLVARHVGDQHERQSPPALDSASQQQWEASALAASAATTRPRTEAMLTAGGQRRAAVRSETGRTERAAADCAHRRGSGLCIAGGRQYHDSGRYSP